MRKLALVAILALAGTMTLAACSNNNADKQQSQQAVQKVSKPTNPNDTEAWQKYLSQVLGQHLQGMTASRPHPYLIPAGSSSAAKAGRQRQLNNVTGVVLRGVTPGNLLAFAGPSSTKTADLVIKAFKQVSPGAMKGVIVLFIGDQADKQRVGAVVKPTGAEYRFVQM